MRLGWAGSFVALEVFNKTSDYDTYANKIIHT